MRFTKLFIATALALAALCSCKTTEANYRAAYEKAMEAKAEQDSLESTVYGNYRRQKSTRTVVTPKGNVEVNTQLVRVTEGGGGIAQNLQQYNVVIGQFKQLFNAKSLRERLVDMGYPSAFVVETAEPFYYIVLSSHADASDAQKALDAFAAKAPVPMKAPCPFILDATARRR